MRPADDADPRELLRQELARVGARLRSLALTRLGAPGTDGGPPMVQQAHGCAQRLADLAADASGRPRRTVPAISLHGVADQVTVTGDDLLAEGDDDAVRAGLAALVGLRAAL